MKIFFNSSMPRSGSTLLQNILGNRPDVYSTPTSPVIDFLIASRKAYTKSVVVKAQDEKQMKDAFLTYCLYGLHGYFKSLTDKPYVMEKSRGWFLSKKFLESFYEKPKVICMVRDLRDIVASMEKNYRKHPDKFTFEDENMESIGNRVGHWLSPNNKPVGKTLNNLREGLQMGFGKDTLFIKFEDLSKSPKAVMKKIHEYLEMPDFDYDFDNIQQVTFENDKFHGIYGDHKIKNSITPIESKAEELLGKSICDKIYERNLWYFKTFKYEK